ncbi:MAG: hypothetical protein HY905_13755 [Deltaproteobacteria bacterium]|nr:hypothetical protein [Deltaproteobacteria bacterium]
MRHHGVRVFAILISCGCAAGTTHPVPPAAPATCGDLVERYRQVLASAAGTCGSDADCAKYGGLDPDQVCGGSTDAATARALTGIADESDAAGCPRPGYSCPPIAVRCLDGVCR